MTKHKLVLGIEHLMSGVQVRAENNGVLEFSKESPSTVRVDCEEPIEAYWPVKQAWLPSAEYEVTPSTVQPRVTTGEVEYVAQVVAPAMVKADRKSYDMRNYTRTYQDRDIPGEPKEFPPAVVKAMRQKHGALANEYLAALRWSGDHWYYMQGNMYVGVEPDGYIHT